MLGSGRGQVYSLLKAKHPLCAAARVECTFLSLKTWPFITFGISIYVIIMCNKTCIHVIGAVVL